MLPPVHSSGVRRGRAARAATPLGLQFENLRGRGRGRGGGRGNAAAAAELIADNPDSNRILRFPVARAEEPTREVIGEMDGTGGASPNNNPANDDDGNGPPIPEKVSLAARKLMNGLLHRDPMDRLGSNSGADEIKKHPFFCGINWSLIRCMNPPGLDAALQIIGKESEVHNLQWEVELRPSLRYFEGLYRCIIGILLEQVYREGNGGRT